MHDIPVPSSIQPRYLPRNRGTTLLLAGMVGVGALAFFALLASNPDRAWQAYVANWLFFTGIAAGAVLLSAITVIVKAKWNWSVRRLSIAFGAFLPLSYLLLLPMLRLRESYFPWIEKMEYDEIVQLKAAYLNIPFLVTRNLVAPAILFGILLLFMYWMLRPDLAPERQADEGGDAGRAKWRERIAGNWLGQAEEEARSWAKLKRLAPAVAIFYAVILSFLAIDWAMSLEPHWFSMLFPGWYFMGALWGGIGAVIIAMVLLKRGDTYFNEHMGPYQKHDLGKLFFGFSVFWAYLFFSQYIVIWYGKLPWEQAWIIQRSNPEWGPISLLVIFLCFVVPFVGLMGKNPKLRPLWLGSIAAIALFGLWLERWMYIAPSLHESGTPTFTFWELLIGIGFLGIFAASVRWFLATFPVIQIWQPPQEPERLEAETEEPLDADAARV
jgi:Ni/Fe-hydrogenase subunit HybB-like protein